MQHTNHHNTLNIQKAIHRSHPIMEFASLWDSTINHELRRFAQAQWPKTRFLGLIPMYDYRLRKKLEPETMVWWVERDIQPFDRYRCDAYRVELSLTEANQARLVVRSGTSEYSLEAMSAEGLAAALKQAGKDSPMLVFRDFGPALDP